MRRKRNNPASLLLLGLVGLGVVAAGVGVAVALKDKSPDELGPFKSGEGFLLGDCFIATNGQAGFNVGSVPPGDEILFVVIEAGSASSNTLFGRSLDVPGLTVRVPVGAIVGGGDCGVGV